MGQNNMNCVASAAFICAATLLTGCTPKLFVHDNKNAGDFERDKYECQMIATQYTANLGFAGNPLIIADQIERCLTLKYGWRLQSTNSYTASPRSETVKSQTEENSDSSISAVRDSFLGKRVRIQFEPMGLYAEPSTDSNRLERLDKRSYLTAVSVDRDWVKVKTENWTQGWIKRIWIGQIN